MAIFTGLSLNKKIKIFQICSLIRHVENEISVRYSKGKMRCPVHLSIGQEGVPAALSLLINKKDFAVSTHRAHAHYISKGGSCYLDEYMETIRNELQLWFSAGENK